MHPGFGSVLVVSFLLFFSGIVDRSAATTTPPDTEQEPTGVVEKGGEFLPMDAVFLDESGNEVTLKQLITQPALLLPVYYNCPRICSFDLANLALALQQTSIAHDAFQVITLSFDEAEDAEDAARTKKNYTAMLAGDYSTERWHFLTGSRDNILRVTDSIGYSFRQAPDGLFIHPSALVAVGSDGKIIKYVYGTFLSGDVDLALSEAIKGTPATSIKRFLAFCLSADPEKNRFVFNAMKGAVITLLAIGGFALFRLLRRSR